MSAGDNQTFANMSMLSQALLVPEKKNRTVKVKKSDVIKFPEFLSALDIVTDEYWKDVLEKAAKGKFHRSFTYDNGILSFKKGVQNVLLPNDPVGLANTFINFLRQYGKLYSPKDLDYMNNLALSESQMEDSETYWKKIYKSKDARKIFVRKYINKKYAEYSQSVRDEIFTQINNATDYGNIKNKDFIFQEGEIIDIQGYQLVYDPTVEKHVVILDKPLKFKQTTMLIPEPEIPKQYQHRSNWTAFLSKFMKNSMSGTENPGTSSYLSKQDSSDTPDVSNSNMDDD